MTELIDIHKLKPSTYNPRITDPERLELIKLSIRKLGFLLPIYADHNGEIISGHQRHLACVQMKVKQVPVEYIEPIEIEKRKAINILFNRATNDFKRNDTCKTVTEELQRLNVFDLSKKLNDIKPGTPDFYLCYLPDRVLVKDLIQANKGRWNKYSRNLAVSLFQKKILMPIICTKDLKVINGIGRLELLAEKKKQYADVVFLTKEKALFAKAMLNLLSMDFDIHNKYEDLLRYNSFRRALTNRAGLGIGFYIAVFGKITSKEFKFNSPSIISKWKAYYGKKVLDFGAGHLTDTNILREIGIEVTPFEPYKIKPGTNEIDKDESIKMTTEFLEKIKTGYQWNSIFISSVLNSVPFLKDRAHIVRILSASAYPKAKVFVWAMSIKQHQYLDLQMQSLNQKCSKSIQFKLDYEPGIILGGFSEKPKVQKFHTPIEIKELFNLGFEDVKVKSYGCDILAVATKPKIHPEQIKAAIKFEFDLPYPDGSKMNLINLALESFSKRLKVKL